MLRFAIYLLLSTTSLAYGGVVPAVVAPQPGHVTVVQKADNYVLTEKLTGSPIYVRTYSQLINDEGKSTTYREDSYPASRSVNAYETTQTFQQTNGVNLRPSINLETINQASSINQVSESSESINQASGSSESEITKNDYFADDSQSSNRQSIVDQSLKDQINQEVVKFNSVYDESSNRVNQAQAVDFQQRFGQEMHVGAINQQQSLNQERLINQQTQAGLENEQVQANAGAVNQQFLNQQHDQGAHVTSINQQQQLRFVNQQQQLPTIVGYQPQAIYRHNPTFLRFTPSISHFQLDQQSVNQQVNHQQINQQQSQSLNGQNEGGQQQQDGNNQTELNEQQEDQSMNQQYDQQSNDDSEVIEAGRMFNQQFEAMQQQRQSVNNLRVSNQGINGQSDVNQQFESMGQNQQRQSFDNVEVSNQNSENQETGGLRDVNQQSESIQQQNQQRSSFDNVEVSNQNSENQETGGLRNVNQQSESIQQRQSFNNVIVSNQNSENQEMVGLTNVNQQSESIQQQDQQHQSFNNLRVSNKIQTNQIPTLQQQINNDAIKLNSINYGDRNQQINQQFKPRQSLDDDATIGLQLRAPQFGQRIFSIRPNSRSSVTGSVPISDTPIQHVERVNQVINQINNAYRPMFRMKYNNAYGVDQPNQLNARQSSEESQSNQSNLNNDQMIDETSTTTEQSNQSQTKYPIDIRSQPRGNQSTINQSSLNRTMAQFQARLAQGQGQAQYTSNIYSAASLRRPLSGQIPVNPVLEGQVARQNFLGFRSGSHMVADEGKKTERVNELISQIQEAYNAVPDERSQGRKGEEQRSEQERQKEQEQDGNQDKQEKDQQDQQSTTSFPQTTINFRLAETTEPTGQNPSKFTQTIPLRAGLPLVAPVLAFPTRRVTVLKKIRPLTSLASNVPPVVLARYVPAPVPIQRTSTFHGKSVVGSHFQFPIVVGDMNEIPNQDGSRDANVDSNDSQSSNDSQDSNDSVAINNPDFRTRSGPMESAYQPPCVHGQAKSDQEMTTAVQGLSLRAGGSTDDQTRSEDSTETQEASKDSSYSKLAATVASHLTTNPRVQTTMNTESRVSETMDQGSLRNDGSLRAQSYFRTLQQPGTEPEIFNAARSAIRQNLAETEQSRSRVFKSRFVGEPMTPYRLAGGKSIHEVTANALALMARSGGYDYRTEASTTEEVTTEGGVGDGTANGAMDGLMDRSVDGTMDTSTDTSTEGSTEESISTTDVNVDAKFLQVMTRMLEALGDQATTEQGNEVTTDMTTTTTTSEETNEIPRANPLTLNNRQTYGSLESFSTGKVAEKASDGSQKVADGSVNVPMNSDKPCDGFGAYLDTFVQNVEIKMKLLRDIINTFSVDMIMDALKAMHVSALMTKLSGNSTSA